MERADVERGGLGLSGETGAPAIARPAGLLRSGAARVWLLTAGLAATAALVYVFAVRPLAPIVAPVHIPWWGLAVLFAVADLYVIHVQFRRDAHSFSVSEIPLVLGLFFATPTGLVAAQMVGIAVILIVQRRQAAAKVAFNLANLALAACASLVIFHTLLGAWDPIGPAGWVAALVATLATALISAAAIFIAISVSEGDPRTDQLWLVVGFAVATTLANASLALVGVTVLWRDQRAAWLLLVPAAVLFLAYRAYTEQRQKNESLEFLYEASRILHGSREIEPMTRALLDQTRTMFRAEVAVITLLPAEPGDAARRTTLGPGDDFRPMHEVELDPTQGVWARIAAEGSTVLLPRPIENERLRTHFEERGIRDAVVAPLDAEGGVIGTILVGNRLGDVSTFSPEDAKLLETLARHAGVSLENLRLVGRLEESLVHLTEMNRLKDDFVATVSHELRTPLTSILGALKTLLRPSITTVEPAERRLLLEAADTQADRLRRLIDDLLVVSRIESRTLHTEPADVDLSALVAGVAADLRGRGHGQPVVIELAAGLPVVRTDEGKVRQIVANLVENALKYSPGTSRVVVRGRADRDGVILSVEDGGGGIPTDQRDRIFDRFYQVDQSVTRQVGGTGLGLYICRRLAEAIGGRVWLERTGPNGSVFSAWIPIEASHVRDPAGDAEAASRMTDGDPAALFAAEEQPGT